MTAEMQPPAGPAPASTTPAPAPTTPTPVVARPKRSSNRILDAALVGAAALAIGGVAFGVGRATAPSSAAGFRDGTAFNGRNFTPNGSFAPGAGPRGAFGLGAGLSIDGTVTAVDANQLTLKLADGQEMTFKLDTSTTYHDATAGSASDVAVGDDVSVKLNGGARVQAGADPSAPPQLSASDVTVRH